MSASFLSSPLNFISLIQICSQARILFKASKNCEGYFGAEDLHKQVNHAIDIFEKAANEQATNKQAEARA